MVEGPDGGIGADKEIARLLPIIFDSIADGVTVLDRSGTLRYANAAAARIMGFQSALLGGRKAGGDRRSIRPA